MIRLLPLLLMLCACGEGRPEAPSSEQSDSLNEAEELLNEAAAQDASK